MISVKCQRIVVVHYQNIFIKNNSKLIEVTNERYEKLINTKKARRTTLYGYTLPSPGPSTARTDYSEHRPRRSSELDPAGRFPLYCMICRKMVQRDEKDGREFPTKLTLESTEETLRMAVALRHDKEFYSWFQFTRKRF